MSLFFYRIIILSVLFNFCSNTASLGKLDKNFTNSNEGKATYSYLVRLQSNILNNLLRSFSLY